MSVIEIVELVGSDPLNRFAHVAGKYFVDVADVDNPKTWRFSDDIAAAKVFKNAEELTSFYFMQSSKMPRRLDGKPNRPLTAFTVIFRSVS